MYLMKVIPETSRMHYYIYIPFVVVITSTSWFITECDWWVIQKVEYWSRCDYPSISQIHPSY